MSGTEQDPVEELAELAEKEETQEAPKKVPARKRYKEDFDWDEGILGEGAFGEVKRAVDKETGIVYAIKILNKKHIIEQKKLEWVNREKFLLDKLRHPNIANLYFTFSDPQNLHFVLEFCPHGEILDHIRKHKCFSFEVGQFYAAEIISALEFMHGQGVAHRDLKPENILLGEGMHAKIVDFGTARDLGNDRSARSKSFVGTAEYVCPELLVVKEAGLSADLWSLGVMLYQFFAGRPPFKAPSEYLIFQMIQSRDFIYPNNFPDVAKDLIDQLLELDPDKRIGNREPGGYEELKAHSFFDGIDWHNLPNTSPPPIRPPAVLPEFPEPPKSSEQIAQEKEEEEKKRQTEERARKLNDQKSSVWAQFVLEDELIIEQSLVVKKKGWSKVKRQLILTDKPRLFYVDPEKMIIRGEITWCKEISVDKRNNKHFYINVPGRSYDLQESNSNAQKWVDAVNRMKSKVK